MLRTPCGEKESAPISKSIFEAKEPGGGGAILSKQEGSGIITPPEASLKIACGELELDRTVGR
jgi:hypothetical protein